jgi:hypothetical protein
MAVEGKQICLRSISIKGDPKGDGDILSSSA